MYGNVYIEVIVILCRMVYIMTDGQRGDLMSFKLPEHLQGATVLFYIRSVARREILC